MKRYVSFLIFAWPLFLSGCATSKNYALAVHSWMGASSEQLIRVWGYPDRVSRIGNRHGLYLYRTESKGAYPQFVNPGYTSVSTSKGQTLVTTMPPTVSGGGFYDLQCKTWFEINSHGRIVNTSFRGNNCVSTHDDAQHFKRSVK